MPGIITPSTAVRAELNETTSGLTDDLDCWRDVWVHSLTYQMLSDDERERDTKNFKILKRLAIAVSQ